MSWAWVLAVVAILASFAALASLVYWQLIIAEGTYLGPGVVAVTYDWVARRYDGIKRFRAGDEDWFVARPLLEALNGVQRPLVLDVATGTGRLPVALLRNHFPGQIVGLDLSRGMLRQARSKLRFYRDQVYLIWQDANHLPFSEGTFDAVTCMESLEFMPQPRRTLAEMARVLAPGGVLWVTNRVGREARLLPGRAIPRADFEEALAALCLRDVEVRRWQVNYDLVLARKSGPRSTTGRGGVGLEAVLLCPGCGGGMQAGAASLLCPSCGRSYSREEGVVALAGRRR
jgi:SAM-dependent methyltransferase